MDYYCDAGPVWAGDTEIALGKVEVAISVAGNLIASSDYKLVVGLGNTGLSIARHLYSKGEKFAVVDTRREPPGLEQLQKEMPEVSVFAGDIPSSVIESAGDLFVSPGVALDEPLVARAIAAGARVRGDIDLFVAAAQAPVIGITGSNAKSTVTAMVGQMALVAGIDAGVGGNLGTPALELLSPQQQLYVVELSSFQLERAASLNLSVATVLNISADHLDRHGSMPKYHQAKHRIFRGCRKAVVNRDDRLTIPLVDDTVEIISWRMGEPELNGFGLLTIDDIEMLCHGFEPLLASSELGLAGRHNVANGLAALAIGHAAGLPESAMVEVLKQFSGLPHRCQLVASQNGVDYVNDSKATNIGATQAAINGLGRGRNLLLIAGGEGKGANFQQLKSAIEKHCKLLLLIGEAAGQIQSVVGEQVPTIQAESLQDAMTEAAVQATAGDIVLLSPACASFDMFSDYQARGDEFSRLAQQMTRARL
ncbi:MAG: UDP-N-acetylmuramoylalanine--D-glutamate ligase [Halieaceae bacterium]